MSYPKKRSTRDENGILINNLEFNQCLTLFTAELKKRADVEKLAQIIFMEATWENYDKKLKNYIVCTATAISRHILEGIEEGK